MIFSVPWVRLREYYDDLLIYSGQDLTREIPELEEEKELAEMLKANIEAEKK